MNLRLLSLPDTAPADPLLLGPTDLKNALTKCVEDFLSILDFRAAPLFTVLLSIIYSILCIVLPSVDQPIFFPLMPGFALVCLFLATGFYEVSRRREHGFDTCWAHVSDPQREPSLPSILALGVVLLTVSIGWLATAERIYLWLFGPAAPESTTSLGWTLIILGNAIGSVFAIVVLSISVGSFPLPLDCNVGVAVAIHTSVGAVLANPLTMALWGLIIAASFVFGFLFVFVGLAFVAPILAHASWHLYRSVVP